MVADQAFGHRLGRFGKGDSHTYGYNGDTSVLW